MNIIKRISKRINRAAPAWTKGTIMSPIMHTLVVVFGFGGVGALPALVGWRVGWLIGALVGLAFYIWRETTQKRFAWEDVAVPAIAVGALTYWLLL